MGAQKHEHLLLQLCFWLSLLTCSLSRRIWEVFVKLPSCLQMVCNSDSSCSKNKQRREVLLLFSYVYKFVTRLLFKVWIFVSACNMSLSKVAGLMEGIKGVWHTEISLLWQGFFLPELVWILQVWAEVAQINAITCDLCSHDQGAGEKGSHVILLSWWEFAGEELGFRKHRVLHWNIMNGNKAHLILSCWMHFWC